MGKRGRKSSLEAAANLEIKESELNKTEELNRREKKALDDRADLIRRRQALDSVETAGDEFTPDGPPNPFEAMDPGFIEALESLNSEGQMVVYRESKTGMAKVAHYPVMDAETMERQLDSIAHEHGGGTFVVRLLGPNGKIAKQKSFTFDPKAYAKEGPAADNSQSMMIQMMIESRKETADLLKTFIMAQAANKPASGLSLQDVIALQGSFKGQGGGQDMKAVTELVTTILAMSKDLADGKVPGTEGADEGIMKNLVGPFLGLLSNIQAQRGGRPAIAGPVRPGATMKPLPNGPALPAAPESAPVEVAVDPSVQRIKSNFFYKMYVPTLLKAMVDKTDVDAVADDILKAVPETHHGMIEKFASMPDVVEFLASFEPSVREHAEWVKAVALSIVDALADEEEPEVLPEESPDGLNAPIPLNGVEKETPVTA
jgi:hypothetical protein